MARLKIRVLGGFEASLDGRELKFPTRHSRLLLAYLALAADKNHSREKLATLFWGDRAEEQARASLRQTLYRLRRLLEGLEPLPLDIDTQTVRLAGDSHWCDAIALENAISGGPEAIEQAFGLYKGELLANCGAVDPAFETWLMGEQLRLKNLASEGFHRLAEFQHDQRRFGEMEATARKLVQLNRFDEAAHRGLMAACALLDRRHAALTAYQDLGAMLKNELGLQPEQQTTMLFTAIHHGKQLRWEKSKHAAADVRWGVSESIKSGSAAGSSGPLAEEDVDIAQPVSADQVVSSDFATTETPSLDNLYPEPPDKPSIAVLPFRNLSANSDYDDFPDGITEDIITALSRSPWLFVIGRSSSFTYRDKAVDIKQAARELGVRYILAGSVRIAGNRLRVNAQLIDGTEGAHAWAEKYDGTIDDVFDLQDEITRKVVSSLHTQIRLSDSLKPLVGERPSIRTWSHLRRAWGLLLELRPESFVEAQRLMEQAIDLDPKFNEGYYLLAVLIFHEIHMGIRRDRDGSLINKALALARHSVALEDTNEYAHWVLGLVLLYKGNLEQSIVEQERAIELNPNCSLAYGSLGTVLALAGEADRSIQCNEIAIRSNPLDPSLFFRYGGVSLAHFVVKRYEEAINWSHKAIIRRSNYDVGHAVLAASFWHLGQKDKAEAAVSEYCSMIPDARVSDLQRLPFRNAADLDRLINALRNAGMPE